jgi:hypothetical protein
VVHTPNAIETRITRFLPCVNLALAWRLAD